MIDGQMGEDVWQAASRTEYFVDIQGDLKLRTRFDTRVKMLWDDGYFYFFAALDDPHVRATFTEHNSYIFHEDSDIEIFTDPHHYFELEENAFATYWELSLETLYRDGGRARDEFDFLGPCTQVYVDGVINNPSVEDKGWSAEIAIP